MYDVDVWDCEVYEDLVGTWSVSGNKIIVAFGSETEEVTVTKLNSTTLVVTIKYDFFEDGQSVTVVETFTRS